MKNSRELSILLLQTILENKIFASEAKSKIIPHDCPDQAFINMLVQTSLRHLVYIRSIIKTFIRKKLPANAKEASYALILATTEVLYLNTPDYAVINSYVEIIKKNLNKYIAGFINAILRKICTEKERFRKEDCNAFFPQEFRRLLNLSYSKNTVFAIEQASVKEPMLDITVKKGVTILDSQTLPLGSVRLSNNGNITLIDGYSQGKWWVQDFSSALPVKLIPELKNKKVLDLCSAPGGKTAQLISEGAKVTSVDVSPTRLQRLTENLTRLQLQPENIICADAIKWLEDYEGEKFDIILLDAPCSATGTLRRHPELVHIKNIKDIDTMTKIQKQMLNNIPSVLKTDGLLIYCTCSLSKQEGEQQISEFLHQHPNFQTVLPHLPPELKSLQTTEGWIRILPSHLKDLGGADGFFIAILQKRD